jgi:hypothetical protein
MPVGGVFVNRIPVDPFGPAERAALRPLLAAHDVLGGESFRRPELAARETARLRTGTKHAIYALPELPHAGLLDALTDEIEKSRRVRPSMRP